MSKTSFNFSQKSKPSWWHFLDLPILNPGAIVEGTVIEKTPKALYLDLEKYGSGIIWGAEFLASFEIIEKLKIGDKIQAKVLNSENEEGFIELSLRGADKEMGWKWIKEIFNKNETISGKVLSANRGGLIININNFQGFLPTSQMNEEHFPKVEGGDKEKILESLEKLIGQEIKVKILEFNARENKIIFSEKKIDEEKLKILLEQYKIGDIVSGTITKIVPNGAYLTLEDNPKIQGFIQVSEIDWQPPEKVEEILKIGEKQQAKIIALKDSELKLSLKALKKDPWLEKIEKYKEGQVVSGEIYKFVPFGALVKLETDLFGFVHSSEFGGLEEMKQKLKINNTYKFVIDSIKTEEKRINLKYHP